jgi:hypothetical protein
MMVTFMLLKAPDGIAVRICGKMYITGYTYDVPEDVARAMMELTVFAHDNIETMLRIYKADHGL